MKHTIRVLTAILLSICILSSASVTSSAASIGSCAASGLHTFLNKFIDVFGKGLVFIFPDSPLVKKADKFEPDERFTGTEEFLDEPAEGAVWSLGYAQASILPDDFGTADYYKGGYSLNKKVTECIDDLKVRVIVLNDGSGRGSVAIAAVDCIGLANHDVLLIRDALSDYAEENDIVSINVSCTHTHSGIDTQGVYTALFKAIAKNLTASTIKAKKLIEPAISPDFLNNIIEKTRDCVIEANENMTTGTLSYATVNAENYVRDRTDPKILDTNLSRIMFTPDNGGKSTIIASMGVHPEGVGFVRDQISSDFVYYTEQVLDSFGYNFIFIQGKLGTYTEKYDYTDDGIDLGDRADSVVRYGEEIGYVLAGMTLSEAERIAISDEAREAVGADSEKYTAWYDGLTVSDEYELEPLLNIRSEQFLVKLTNPLYALLAKLSLADNDVYRKCFTYYSPTEAGYMQLGDITCILCPGETYAELQLGGENMADFPYGCLNDELGTENILVFDLMNDAVGYIMPDKYFTYVNVYYDDGLEVTDAWGLTSVGRNAASEIYGKIYEIIEKL